jgi:hypothetical protein
VQALALFATWLDRVFHVPWPLVLALFFLPVVGALDVGVWYLRGMVFPIHCGYLRVRGKGRCQRMTAGEWHKCWYHRRRRLGDLVSWHPMCRVSGRVAPVQVPGIPLGTSQAFINHGNMATESNAGLIGWVRERREAARQPR